jgi:ribonuclease R
MKKAEFMENKIWETYEGQISWVISAWIFVSLNNTVEGFISKDKLWTYAAYSEDFMNFHNSKTKESFTLWDKIKIKVESVDKQNWRIYFEIV